MTDIWKFSPSSEYLVKKCIAAGSSFKDENNKWVRKFLLKDNITTEIPNNIDLTYSNPNHADKLMNTQETTISDPLSVAFEDDLIDNIETDPVMQMKTIANSKNTKIFTFLAKRLSAPAVEKICEHTFDTKNMDTTFIENFIVYFFPEYLKRDNSRFTLDLILQAFKGYPLHFKTLLTVLLKDRDIPCSFIQSFVQSLTEEEKLEFLTYVMEIPLSKEEFVQHLSAICLAYKDCPKSDILQRNIFQSLKEFSGHCMTDKNYGKLLLTFLQTHDNYGFPLDFELTSRLLEIHRSPFKRPCMTVYASLVNKMSSQDRNT